MTSMFDYDDDVNIVFDAKIAGKNLVAAKHELLTKTGDFLFMAHSERELAYRMQMVEEDIEKTAYRKLSSVSDSKAKLVRAVLEEWQIRHASCQFCKTANMDGVYRSGPEDMPNRPRSNQPERHPDHEDYEASHCSACSRRGAPNRQSECDECAGTGSSSVQQKLKGIGRAPGADMMRKQILDDHAESLARGTKNQRAKILQMDYQQKMRGTPFQGLDKLGTRKVAGEPHDPHGCEICDANLNRHLLNLKKIQNNPPLRPDPNDPYKILPQKWDPNAPHAPIPSPKEIQKRPPSNPHFPKDPDKRIPHPWDPNVPHAPIPSKKDLQKRPPSNPTGCKICDEYDQHNH